MRLDRKQAKRERRFCRHCLLRVGSCSRSLCGTCYRRPAIRSRYAPVTIAGQRAVAAIEDGGGDFFGGHALPAVPTSALPGTDAKKAVLSERFDQRVSLWHPADARADVR